MTKGPSTKPAAYKLSNGRWVHPACYYEATKPADSDLRAAKIDVTSLDWPATSGRRVVNCALCGESGPHTPLPSDVPVRGSEELGARLAGVTVYQDDAIQHLSHDFLRGDAVPMHVARRALSELRFWIARGHNSEPHQDRLFEARDLLARSIMDAQRHGVPARRRHK